jgi:hypothetical protein
VPAHAHESVEPPKEVNEVPNPRRPQSALFLVALLLLVLLGAYVGGYLWLGEVSTTAPKMEYIKRNYKHELVATMFGPAAWLESMVRGVDVQAVSVPGGGPL